MSKIIFQHDGTQTQIQCNPQDKVSAVLDKFCVKVQKDKSDRLFLYCGNIVDEQKTVEQLPKTFNEPIIIVVTDTKDSNQPASTKVKSKEVICPKCSEAATVSIDDEYKISIINCKNGHETKNLNISEFNSTQMFDMSKVACDKCKDRNMSNVFNNQFYRCLDCKMNLCPICKSQAHDPTDNIINYVQKNYICEEDGEPCIYYCINCKRNLCFSCEYIHMNHEIVDFRTLKKSQEDLKKEITKFREYIDKAKQIAEADINYLNQIKYDFKTINMKNYSDIWSKVLSNLEIIYRIKNDLFEVVKKSQRNYENLLSQQFIIKKFDNDINGIINGNDINDRYKKILNIYEKMIIKKEENKNIIIIKYKINKN